MVLKTDRVWDNGVCTFTIIRGCPLTFTAILMGLYHTYCIKKVTHYAVALSCSTSQYLLSITVNRAIGKMFVHAMF